MLRAATAVAIVALVLAGCGGGSSRSAPGPTVVATTTQAADLARNLAGDRADVVGLLEPNSDPHAHELRPDDVKALADADLVIRSGGDLDAWLDGAIDSSGFDGTQLTLMDHVRTIEGDDGPDPHWWQDPRNAQRAVEAIRDALVEADPDGAAAYRRSARAYLAELRELDAAVASCLNSVPAERRKLVTTHDALGYYAARYEVDVVGTVIPSLSTRAQPSAGDVSALVDTIEREKVGTIFAQASVNPKVERAIARETGAAVGEPLWADALGPADSSGATYLGSIAANTRALASGFGASPASCDL